MIELCDGQLDFESLRTLARSWLDEYSANQHGLEIDIDIVLSDLQAWNDLGNSAVMMLNKTEGILAITAVDSFIGRQRMAVVKYWYVLPECRTQSHLLLEEAKRWSKDHDCTHMIISASTVEQDKYDRLCRFYTRQGMKLFETSFLCEV
jgi:hypothetical protein